jgi:hypothetical protein
MLVALAVLCMAGPPVGRVHFDVEAVFEPAARKGQDDAIVVTFTPRDPDVKINEDPAPSLKLDPLQLVLEDRQKPAIGHGPAADPEAAKYLDLAKPVRFPVARSAQAPPGPQNVRASVTYFYCSTREGWCRRGKADMEVAVGGR